MTANRHVIRTRLPRGTHGPIVPVADRERVAAYLQDAAHVPGGHATAVVAPQDERQVADTLRSAANVLVVGAQSSLTGGATPRGDVVISTARLQRLEPVDGGVRAGAGVTIAQVDEWLRPRNAMYPPGPTWTGATVGGTVATNAAGAATFKYGSTRQWVQALTVVLASGDVLDIERGRTFAHPAGYFDIALPAHAIRVPVPTYRMPNVPKVSAGYFAAPEMDLIDLFIGAEGTLGVVTDVTLRVRPERPDLCLALIAARDRGSALALVGALREEAHRAWRTAATDGIDVCAIEHMDARSLALLREDGADRQSGISLDPNLEMLLLVTIELSPPAATDVLHRLGSMVEAHGICDDVIVAAPGDAAAARRLLALREAVPLAVNTRVGRAQRDVDPRIEKTAADTIVPFERFEEMLDVYEREARRRGLDMAVWGHISDGNVHPNIIPRSAGEAESGRQAVLAFGREAIRLGGAPLAEHGVGRSRIKQLLLAELYGLEGIEQMRRVKRALDPSYKLARGVLFDAVPEPTAQAGPAITR